MNQIFFLHVCIKYIYSTYVEQAWALVSTWNFQKMLLLLTEWHQEIKRRRKNNNSALKIYLIENPSSTSRKTWNFISVSLALPFQFFITELVGIDWIITARVIAYTGKKIWMIFS